MSRFVDLGQAFHVLVNAELVTHVSLHHHDLEELNVKRWGKELASDDPRRWVYEATLKITFSGQTTGVEYRYYEKSVAEDVYTAILSPDRNRMRLERELTRLRNEIARLEILSGAQALELLDLRRVAKPSGND